MQKIFFFALLLTVVACGAPNPGEQQAVLPPTQTSTRPPSRTLAPTATATARQQPTITPLPPTATPEPHPELVQYTIEGLRSRDYGSGSIEIVSVMEETANFTRYLFAYPGDGLRITGMLNRPHGEGPFPVVILNHGWYPLDVYQTGNGTQLAADYLANNGFLTLSPDYRNHAGSDDAPNVFRAGHVIDTLNLIPLAQKLPESQPGKIGMWGHSNGGAITAKVLTVSDQIAAALIYAPASSNIVEDYWFRVERAALRNSEINAVNWPVRPEEAPALYERLSPLNYAPYVTAKVLIIWGTQDEIVPRNWPEDLYLSLEAAGKDVEFVVYEGQPHSFNAAGNADYLPLMVGFFQAELAQ
jgi:dipeptidyl aminopeptidase/acylaminoacyl peptidase